jgi:hypothetical protein
VRVAAEKHSILAARRLALGGVPDDLGGASACGDRSPLAGRGEPRAAATGQPGLGDRADQQAGAAPVGDSAMTVLVRRQTAVFSGRQQEPRKKVLAGSGHRLHQRGHRVTFVRAVREVARSSAINRAARR